jgi:filamentous hemagglutinin
MAAHGCAKVTFCRNAWVEKGLSALLSIGMANTALDNLNDVQKAHLFRVDM